MLSRKTYVLMILDGWGIGINNSFNAVHVAQTPFLDGLETKYPKAQLICSGSEVGLPDGVMGNSEVGHLNIGAGRVVYQDLLRIDNAITDMSFYKNRNLNLTIGKVLAARSSLHMIGLLSDGGVHSQFGHLIALLRLAKRRKIAKVFVHVILDGRDTAPDKGIKYIEQLQSNLDHLGCGVIATICGRYYAMDRDQRWDRVEKAYKLFTQGLGRIETNPIVAVEQAYSRGETDEFVQPIVINSSENVPYGLVCDDDAVIFFNFRADRAREISYAFTQSQFNHFDRGFFPKISEYLTMTLYDTTIDSLNMFPPIKMIDSIGEVISLNGLNQLRIAETEKYAHVTYFFNGGDEEAFPNEDRCLVPSPREVDTYDKKPEMSAWLVVEEVIKHIESGKYDFIVINFANMDMVGHAGFFNPAVKACEIVDKCVEKVINKLLENDGIAVITADHGNSEKMLTANGKPFTAHTTNKVPFLSVGRGLEGKPLRKHGSLGDVAPTVLDLMGIKKPIVMTGRSLFDL